MSTTLGNGNITFGDSTAQGTAYAGIGGQVFTSPGTFTIPTGVTKLKVTVQGGGAGGTPSPGPVSGGYGGSGGGFGFSWLTGLTPGGTIAVTVGAGGAASVAGGSSSISSGTQAITTVTATGGSVGPAAPGGTCSGATFNCAANRASGLSSSATMFCGSNPTPSANSGAGGWGGSGGGAGSTGAAGIVIFEW